MQYLKLNPATRKIPVLFYTISEDQDSGAVLALDYLAKPVDDEVLMRAFPRQGIACESISGKRCWSSMMNRPCGTARPHPPFAYAQLPRAQGA